MKIFICIIFALFYVCILDRSGYLIIIFPVEPFFLIKLYINIKIAIKVQSNRLKVTGMYVGGFPTECSVKFTKWEPLLLGYKRQ